MIAVRSSRIFVLIMAFSVLMSGMALATDGLRVDGDGVTAGADNDLDFDEVCPGDTPAKSVLVAVIQQNTNANNNFANGAAVVITRQAITNLDSDHGGLSAPAAVGTINLPADWNTDRGAKVSTAVSSLVTLTVPGDAAEGDYEATIQYRGTGFEADSDGSATTNVLTRNHTLDVIWSVLDEEACASGGGYELDGFYQPVDNALVNGAKAGRVIPLKFNILEEGVKQSDTSLVDVFVMKTACNGGAEHDLLADETLSSGKTELRWDEDGDQMVFNWKTPRSPGCYRIVLEVDGDSIQVDFQLN